MTCLSQLRLPVFLIVLLPFFYGCGGGSTAESPPATTLSSSENKPTAAVTTIGPEGGSLEATDPGNPAYGTRIVVPEGALDQAVQIGISYADDPASLPKTYTIAGSSIVFSPAGLIFRKPILLTIPYNDNNNDGYLDGTYLPEKSIGALYVESAANKWEIFQVTNRDPVKNTVTISTNHFSTYLSYAEASATPAPSPTATTQYLSGEHFLANPLYTYDGSGAATLIRLKAPSHYLSVLRADQGITSIVDAFLTYMADTGYPCVMSTDYTSCTFDAAGFYPKIKNSGDAALWDWQCEFVAEHTTLTDYLVDEHSLVNTSTAERIDCSISAVDETSVQINWGVNAKDEVSYVSHMLAIRLWANYR